MRKINIFVQKLFLVIYDYCFEGGGGCMAIEGKYTKTLKVRIDPELYEQVKKKAKKLDTDVSTYVRWCIQTGLYLEDLNSFIRSKSGEIV